MKKIELEDYFKTSAEENDIPMEEIQSAFEDIFGIVCVDPLYKNKPQDRQEKETKDRMRDFFREHKKKGMKMTFMMFTTIGEPRNWNEKDLNAIYEEIKRGEISKLIREQKILSMKNEEGDILPLKSVEEWETKKRYVVGRMVYTEPPKEEHKTINEWVPKKYTFLEKGSRDVLPRDHRLYTEGGDINFTYGRHLQPAWSCSISGIGSPSGSDELRMIRLSVKGEEAIPTNNRFIFNQYKPFQIYEGNFIVNDEKEHIYEMSYRGVFAALIPIDSIPKADTDTYVEKQLNILRDKFGEEHIPPFITLGQIKDYHESYQVVIKEGKVEKSSKGYDSKHWDRYAILCTNLAEKSIFHGPEEKTKGPAFKFRDGDVPDPAMGWGQAWMNRNSPIPEGSLVLASINTSRGTTRYDRKERKRVTDVENADISISVKSIAELGKVVIAAPEEGEKEDISLML